MTDWDSYPEDYRRDEITQILAAVRAGESVAIIGLSGAGKSNLLGFLRNRAPEFPGELVLADCNRLEDRSPEALWRLISSAMGAPLPPGAGLSSLEELVSERLGAKESSLCLLLDRFDVLTEAPNPALANNLRVLRDAHRYRLTYVAATRRPIDTSSELAELFYAHTLWLGPLSPVDAEWNVRRYAARRGLEWGREDADALVNISGGYASFLRAACEAYAGGASLELEALSGHPAVRRRLDEFWLDEPNEAALEASGISGLPLLYAGRAPQFDTTKFTAKEQLLFDFLHDHSGQMCAKDALIRAVWPEDKIYDAGVRDDSLAQLVRRLRVKIEVDPADPQKIKTIPGRGYIYNPGSVD
ncbi:MAG: winged helix-turn-helix domain-containing protein [Anaerolineales bacterium]|nr:winged helix-turn-helix domain-containing protein [Anaerolineales bacterium]